MIQNENISQREILTYQHWIEKHSGFILSLCLHILLFSIMITRTVPTIMKNKEDAKKVSILLKKPQPVIKPQRNSAPVPGFVPARATIQNIQDTKTADMQKDVEASVPKPENLPKIEIDKKTISELGAERNQLAKELDNLEKQKNLLKLQLKSEAKAISSAKDYSYTTRGTEKGVVRTLDLKGYPKEIVDDIMKKYNIRIERRFINTKPKEPVFLNSAQTEGNVYLSNEETGRVFEVFILSNEALAKMVILEEEELKKRGYNSDKTMINSVVFGIVRINDEYDLGIKQFDAQQIIE